MTVICHHNGKYNLYSTVSDRFILDPGTDLEGLKAIIKEDYGNKGLAELDARLDRAHKNGHSALGNMTLEEMLDGNCAGDDGNEISYEECIARYLS